MESNIQALEDEVKTLKITKQREYIKTWRRRWFVLKQGKLFWFKESTVTHASRPRGIIPVANCLTVNGAEESLNRQFAFDCVISNDTMYFIADSEKEKNDWINSIRRSIVHQSMSVTDDEILECHMPGRLDDFAQHILCRSAPH
ncbi:hypothetical protein DH2020_020308 [Rehmannia glutinosa]|uniref:PH domain-containing protein n=1 Tax=Rehmannia glutinosa TaxID=99300 RepID=A0ABR0WH88_REHGL